MKYINSKNNRINLCMIKVDKQIGKYSNISKHSVELPLFIKS